MGKLSFDDIIDRRHEGGTTLRQVQLTQLYMLQVVSRICDHYNISYWLDFGTLLGAKRHGAFIPWDDDLDISMSREDYWRFLEVAKEELPETLFLQNAETDPYYDIPEVPTKIRDRKSTFIEDPAHQCHQGIFIDIFPYDRTFCDPQKRKKHQKLYKALIEGARQNIVSPKLWFLHEQKLRKALLQGVYTIIPLSWVEQRVLDRWKKADEWGWRPTLSYKAEDHCFAEEDLFPLKKVFFEGEEFWAPCNSEKHLEILYGDWQQLPPKEAQIPAHMNNADPFTPYKG